MDKEANLELKDDVQSITMWMAQIIQEEVGSKKTEDGKFVPLYEDVEVTLIQKLH